MSNLLDRRIFLSGMGSGIALSTLGLTLGGVFTNPVLASSISPYKTLVLLELKGGNDGLNTVIPFMDKEYYSLRPTLAVKKERVIQLSDSLGFNPAFKSLLPLWKKKELAIVLGVGYPEPNLSHFRGIDIWNTASDAQQFLETGWISRLFGESYPGSSFPCDAINLGYNLLGPFDGGKTRTITLGNNPNKLLKQASRLVPNINNVDNPALMHIVKQRTDVKSAAKKIIENRIDNIPNTGVFNTTKLGDQFETMSRLMLAGVRVPVIKLSIGKFDTHAEQEPLHTQLLKDVGDNIASFAQLMNGKGLWDDILVMTYSEFGRRPKENISGGTDHGTSAPHFFMGGRVRGGFYGKQPTLDVLEDGNLPYFQHYRELYATVAREWWGLRAPFIREKAIGIIV